MTLPFGWLSSDVCFPKYISIGNASPGFINLCFINNRRGTMCNRKLLSLCKTSDQYTTQSKQLKNPVLSLHSSSRKLRPERLSTPVVRQQKQQPGCNKWQWWYLVMDDEWIIKIYWSDHSSMLNGWLMDDAWAITTWLMDNVIQCGKPESINHRPSPMGLIWL